MRVTLDEVCTKATSKYAQKDLANMTGEYPVFGASGFIKNIGMYQQEKTYVAVVKDGAGIGRTMLLPGKSSVIGTMQYLLPKENIIPKFLYYAVKSMHLEKYYTGATIPHIYFKDYKKETFDLPKDIRQKEIINILDKVELIIQSRKLQLKALDELIKSRFIEMFGDLANPQCRYYKCKLEELCSSPDDIKCGPFGTQLNKDEYQTEGVAIWEIPQINSGFNMKPTHFLTNEKARQLKAYSIRPGDIAMSRKGNVGKCALFPFKYEEGIIHSDVLRIRVDKNIVNPCFIVYQLHFSNAIKQQIKVISSGAIMAGINVTKLKGINVHVPSLKDQCKFSDFIDEINKSRLAIQKSLDETQLLFDSLMQKYFG